MVAHALKITVFSIRVGSMGSMEARRRLSLPHQGKWCGGKRDDCTPATDDNLQDRGRTPRAGDAEDEGVTAAAGDLPRAGEGWSTWCNDSSVSSVLSCCRYLLRSNVLTICCSVWQAILDTLSPQLSSMIPGPGCPNLSVLRDVYSLLGEGGERSPAIVLDSEPDWWQNMQHWVLLCLPPLSKHK